VSLSLFLSHSFDRRGFLCFASSFFVVLCVCIVGISCVFVPRDRLQCSGFLKILLPLSVYLDCCIGLGSGRRKELPMMSGSSYTGE